MLLKQVYVSNLWHRWTRQRTARSSIARLPVAVVDLVDRYLRRHRRKQLGHYPKNTPGTITPLSITASITANNKVCDGTATAAFKCSLTGILAIDVNNVSCTGGTASFAGSDAGANQAVTATGLTLTGAATMDYSINTTATTTATLIKADQTISWNTPSDDLWHGVEQHSAQCDGHWSAEWHSTWSANVYAGCG